MERRLKLWLVVLALLALAPGCRSTGTAFNPPGGSYPGSHYGNVNPSLSSFSFDAVGVGYAQNLDVSQPHYTGTYTESDTCSGIATVTVTSNADGLAVYSVTPTGAGTCRITITGGDRKSATVSVTVTITNATVQ